MIPHRCERLGLIFLAKPGLNILGDFLTIQAVGETSVSTCWLLRNGFIPDYPNVGFIDWVVKLIMLAQCLEGLSKKFQQSCHVIRVSFLRNWGFLWCVSDCSAEVCNRSLNVISEPKNLRTLLSLVSYRVAQDTKELICKGWIHEANRLIVHILFIYSGGIHGRINDVAEITGVKLLASLQCTYTQIGKIGGF